MKAEVKIGVVVLLVSIIMLAIVIIIPHLGNMVSYSVAETNVENALEAGLFLEASRQANKFSPKKILLFGDNYWQSKKNSLLMKTFFVEMNSSE